MADVEIVADERPLYRAVERAFWGSVDDMKTMAQGRAPARSRRLRGSASIERRGGLAARVRFDTPYAKAREKGAYIQVKTAKRLVFRTSGGIRSATAVRQPAQPYLWPAGRAWKRSLFINRLRQQTGGSGF